MHCCPYFQSIHLLLPENREVVFGWEALLRGPQNSSFESPAVLFQKARLRGRLKEIDMLAFAMSCRAFAANDPGGILFVNLYPETLLSDSFQELNILRFLHQINLPPNRLVIEINEEHADPADLGRRVKQFTRDGIQFALDDFGTGSSNLTRWADLNPNYLKCDRHIVQGLCKNSRRMQAVKGIEKMCQGGTVLIAEGVETQQDCDCLIQNTDIRLAQGYFFSRPEPLAGDESKINLKNHMGDLKCSA